MTMNILFLHLNNQDINEDMEDLFVIGNNQIRMNMDKWSDVTDRLNELSMEELNGWIPAIKEKQAVYERLVENIITELYNKNSECHFNCSEKLMCETVVCNRNYINEAIQLECKYEKLREEYRDVINGINEFCLDIGDEGSFVRNTILIDAVFRAKEMIRSINLYFVCINYKMDKTMMFEFSEEVFLKYLNNEVITEECYCFHAVMKTYSVCEKVAKFILCKYDFKHEYTSLENFKNMYIEDIINIIEEKQINSKCILEFKKIMEGQIYSHYKKIRHLEYHCLRQEFQASGRSVEIKIGKMYEVFMLLGQLYELLKILVDEEKEVLVKRIEKRGGLI